MTLPTALPPEIHTGWFEAPPGALAAIVLVIAIAWLAGWQITGLAAGLTTRTRLLLLPTVALGTSMIPALLLALAGVLNPLTFVSLLGAVYVGAGLIRRRRGDFAGGAGWRGLPGRLAAGRRKLVVGAITVAIGLIALAPMILVSRVEVLPLGTTTWYYIGLALATAQTGGFPASSPEWGGQLAFQTDYAAVTAQTAALLQVSPESALLLLDASRIWVVVAVATSIVAFLGRWVPLELAAAGSWLVCWTAFVASKLAAYKPETPAVALAFLGLWLVDRWLDRRSAGTAAAIAVVAMLLVDSHAEVFLVWLAFLVGSVVARGHPGSAGRSIVGAGRAILGSGVRVIAIVAVGAGVGVGIQAVASRDIGLLEYARPAEAVAVDQQTLPQGWRLSGDPTWDFLVAATEPLPDSDPPRAFTDRRLLPRIYLHPWLSVDLVSSAGRAAVLALVLVPLLVWRRLPWRQRRWVAWWSVAGAILLLGSLLAWAAASTYVPMRIGPRRLVPYEVVPLVGAIISLVWLVGWFVRRRIRGTTAARYAMPAWIAFVLGVTLWFGAGAYATGLASADGMSSSGWAMLRWIDTNVPGGARIGANLYTDGAIATVAGRLGLIDGRASFLEDPAFLGQSLEDLLASRSYFQDPTGAARSRYLACRRPDYLLVLPNTPDGGAIGGSVPFETDVPALIADPSLRVVHVEDGIMLFAVNPDAAGTCEA